MTYPILSPKLFAYSMGTQQLFASSKLVNSYQLTVIKASYQLTIKAPERRHWRRSTAFIFNLKQF